MFYFSYGSNLNKRSMALRCPGAKPVGLATLRNYKLCFRRYADITLEQGAEVIGAVWEITPAHARALDQFEGNDYGQIQISVVCNAAELQAMAYAMRAPQPLAPPSIEYVREVTLGYRDWGIDEALLRRARYDTLGVGKQAVVSKAQQKTATPPQQRRALWDPAQQSSGLLEGLAVVKRPGPGA